MLKSVAAIVVFTVATALSPSVVMADDWTAVRLRGGVFALENGQWIQLLRGSVVSDDRVIKSAPGGRITLVRGAETIELGPETTAQISDRSGFTTVYNHEGTVGVDAEARNVKHFAVQTPFLAAVVKGTAFTVQTSPTTSTVAVTRGKVEVDDERHDTSVSILAGQQVSSSQDAPITQQSIVSASPDAPKPPVPAAQQPDIVPANSSVSGSGNSNAGRNGDGNSGGSNASGNGDGNSGNKTSGKGNGNSGSDNAGGNGNGNSGSSNAGGNGNGNSGSSNAGGNGNGNSGSSSAGGNGNGNSGSSNAGGNDNGNSGSSNAGANGNGNSESSRGGGDGNGKGKDKDKDRDKD